MRPIYGLDIETDTSPLTDEEKAAGFTSRGLDPAITPITAIALATEYGPYVMCDMDEKVMLTKLDRLLSVLEPGILATWNGAVFDLPFIDARAKSLGLSIGLGLTPDSTIVPKYQPTPGYDGGYRATWAGHHHLDLAYEVKEEAAALGIPWSLKPYAREILGREPIQVDREQMHTLTAEELHEYVASDAIITRDLTIEHLRGKLAGLELR